jgi:hypothetical protein
MVGLTDEIVETRKAAEISSAALIKYCLRHLLVVKTQGLSST